MKLTAEQLQSYRDRFSETLEVLSAMEGHTILGFACIVVTLESTVMLFGGESDIVEAGIDLLASSHHAQVGGPDLIDSLVEDITATVN